MILSNFPVKFFAGTVQGGRVTEGRREEGKRRGEGETGVCVCVGGGFDDVLVGMEISRTI